MDRELLEFLELNNVKKNLNVSGLLKLILKFHLYLLIICLMYMITLLSRAKSFTINLSYGVLSQCKRCVWSKSKESVAIVSLAGYSRDDRVIQVMNYRSGNYTNRGPCNGYKVCGRCLEVIDKTVTDLPCRWIRL